MNLVLLILIIIIFLWICWFIRVRPCTVVMSVVALWLLVWILILLFTNMDSLHVLWIIPVGVFVVPRLYGIIIKIPILGLISLSVATLFRNMIWIGIDKDKRMDEIREYLHKIGEEASKDFFTKTKK